MSRPRIQIQPYLDYADLTRHYQECQDPKTKNHWLAIQLLGQPDTPMPVEQVAEVLGCSPDWVRKLARRYNHLGPAVLTKQPQDHRRRSISPSASLHTSPQRSPLSWN
jgi:hypothetical protein